MGAIGVTAVVGALVAPVGESHPSGPWLYPPAVALKLEAKGLPLPACSGRRVHRFTARSSPNNAQTWQFRHFECITYDAVGGRGQLFICAHSRVGGRVAVIRVMSNNGYAP